MTSCRGYQPLFSAYIDGALDAGENLRLKEHAAQCHDCRQALEGLKQMVAVLNKLPSPETPDLLPAIHARLSGAGAAAKFSSIRPFSVNWHSLALAMSVVLVVVFVSLPRFLKRQTVMEEVMQKKAVESMPSQETAPLPENKDARMDASAPEPVSSFAPRAGGGGLLGYVSSRQRPDFGVAPSLVGLEETAGQPQPQEYAKSPPAALDDEMNQAFIPQEERQERVFKSLGSVSREKLAQGFMAGSRSGLSSAMPAASFAEPASVGTNAAGKAAEDTVGVAWHVANAQEAMLAVNAWVSSRHGEVKPVGKYQLSVLLPSFELPEFLRRFSDGSTEPLPVPAGSFWVTVFLEIIPQE